MTLECELTHPDVAVFWFKNNERIYPSNTHQIVMDGYAHRLQIESIGKLDSAKFKCQAVSNPGVTTVCTGMQPDFPFTCLCIGRMIIILFSF